ncbi:MAG: pilus assembly protein PilM [Planctomycetota bacterium]|nr:MAG: pilus assembly protein PilM [Planctomycetota bacterium]
MSWFSKNSAYLSAPIIQRIERIVGASNTLVRVWKATKYGAIGVDMGEDSLKVVQLEKNGKSIRLIAGGLENRPEDIEPGSSNWQRWAIKTIRKLTTNGKFRGRDVIAAMPPIELFIDHLKMPKIEEDKLQNAVFSKIKQKLPFEADDAMIKSLPAEEDNVLVIAADRKIIDRHLAIYEKANLQLRSIAVWPLALTKSYTTFFGRRKTDIKAVVMLLDMEPNYTNVVICRHKNLLFARSIPIGIKQDEGLKETGSDETVARLALELTTCKRQFSSMHGKARIERLIFLSSRTVDKNICTTIAKQLEMPAQVGDCLAAVEAMNSYGPETVIDRRNCQVNWTTAFGLSLS